jgi:hypothetical protein
MLPAFEGLSWFLEELSEAGIFEFWGFNKSFWAIILNPLFIFDIILKIDLHRNGEFRPV